MPSVQAGLRRLRSMSVTGTYGSSSGHTLKSQVEELTAENARLKDENLQLRRDVNRTEAQLKAQRSHIQAQHEEIRFERERIEQERELMQKEKIRLKEENEGWGMNRDRNDLMELLSPNWKPTQQQLQPTEVQRQRFAKREVGSDRDSASSNAERENSGAAPQKRFLRRLSTVSSLTSGVSRRASVSFAGLRAPRSREPSVGGGGRRSTAVSNASASSASGQGAFAPRSQSARRRGSVVARAARMIGRPRSDMNSTSDPRFTVSSWAGDVSARDWANESTRSEVDDVEVPSPGPSPTAGGGAAAGAGSSSSDGESPSRAAAAAAAAAGS